MKGAFVETLEVWEETHDPTPPLDVFKASKVSSLVGGVKYDFNLEGEIRCAVSGEFSNFVAGPDGVPWKRQNLPAGVYLFEMHGLKVKVGMGKLIIH